MEKIKKKPPGRVDVLSGGVHLDCGSSSGGINGALLALSAHPLKLHLAIHQGEEGIVATDAHIGAGMDMGTALPDQDVAGQDVLAIGPFYAEAFGLGIAAVRSLANTFFFLHG